MWKIQAIFLKMSKQDNLNFNTCLSSYFLVELLFRTEVPNFVNHIDCYEAAYLSYQVLLFECLHAFQL